MTACSRSGGNGVWPAPGVLPGRTYPPVYVMRHCWRQLPRRFVREMTLALRRMYSTLVCSIQPSASVDLSSNLETFSIGTQAGMISVSSPRNSCVVFAVRDSVRLVYLSKREERDTNALVRRAS